LVQRLSFRFTLFDGGDVLVKKRFGDIVIVVVIMLIYADSSIYHDGLALLVRLSHFLVLGYVVFLLFQDSIRALKKTFEQKMKPWLNRNVYRRIRAYKKR
jgi:hypothetical protein